MAPARKAVEEGGLELLSPGSTEAFKGLTSWGRSLVGR